MKRVDFSEHSGYFQRTYSTLNTPHISVAFSTRFFENSNVIPKPPF